MKSDFSKQGVLVLGASGTGTSTLGHLLAQKLGYSFNETDFFFWEQTNPPFERPRTPELHTGLLSEMIQRNPKFILSGSVCGWGEIVVPHLKTVLFLEAATEIRLERIIRREEIRYGAANIAPGGLYHLKVQSFLEWSRAYEIGGVSRTRELHETWLKELKCPIFRINTDWPIDQVFQTALQCLTGCSSENTRPK